KNAGDGDVGLAVGAQDEEGACSFRFPEGDTAHVPAQGVVKLGMRVTPRSQPLIGAEHQYSFLVWASDTAAPPGTPRMEVRGSYTHLTWIEKLSTILKPVLVIVAIALIVLGARYVVTTEPGPYRAWLFRTEIGMSMLRAQVCQWPLIGNICADDSFAARPLTAVDCAYKPPFKEFHDAASAQIGDCLSDVSYDGFG